MKSEDPGEISPLTAMVRYTPSPTVNGILTHFALTAGIALMLPPTGMPCNWSKTSDRPKPGARVTGDTSGWVFSGCERLDMANSLSACWRSFLFPYLAHVNNSSVCRWVFSFCMSSD